ncbi:hypothetical protein Acor_84330 [Acrocarpospora corrugata]|uniref:Uncharacterized protein n=1 Tax=Acrocarpospora corrugata TaxID=35763 RepID=A0A5M3WBN2_9ACTN|nr:hypothetical protein Acor_84330 [Acrocarpospora corrugata]
MVINPSTRGFATSWAKLQHRDHAVTSPPATGDEKGSVFVRPGVFKVVVSNSVSKTLPARTLRSARPRERRDGVTEGIAWSSAPAHGGLGAEKPPLQARWTVVKHHQSTV